VVPVEQPAPEPAPEAVAPPRDYEEIAPPPPPPPPPAPVVTIGESKDQVIADFGAPQRKTAVGTKVTYFYTTPKQMTVIFINGKVSIID